MNLFGIPILISDQQPHGRISLVQPAGEDVTVTPSGIAVFTRYRECGRVELTQAKREGEETEGS